MATWNQKTYEMVAEVLNDKRIGRIEHDHAIDTIAWEFSQRFELDNKRFDTKRFMIAAGYDWINDDEDDDDE